MESNSNYNNNIEIRKVFLTNNNHNTVDCRSIFDTVTLSYACLVVIYMIQFEMQQHRNTHGTQSSTCPLYLSLSPWLHSQLSRMCCMYRVHCVQAKCHVVCLYKYTRRQMSCVNNNIREKKHTRQVDYRFSIRGVQRRHFIVWFGASRSNTITQYTL